MSESGTKFAYSERITDANFFLVSAFAGVFKSSKVSNVLKEFKGNKILKDNSIIDPELVDAKGNTNVTRMEKGGAPIGPDGKPVNLHHVNQTEEGTIMEITQTEYQQKYSVLHINTGSEESKIDRSKFGIWKNLYWKNRAEDFKK